MTRQELEGIKTRLRNHTDASFTRSDVGALYAEVLHQQKLAVNAFLMKEKIEQVLIDSNRRNEELWNRIEKAEDYLRGVANEKNLSKPTPLPTEDCEEA